jgi:hypothetical protein
MDGGAGVFCAEDDAGAGFADLEVPEGRSPTWLKVVSNPAIAVMVPAIAVINPGKVCHQLWDLLSDVLGVFWFAVFYHGAFTGDFYRYETI